MNKHEPLRWDHMDQAVNRMGEWLLVGSIAAAGLPAIPAGLSLVALMVFFSVRPENRPHPTVRQYIKLQKQKVRSAEEEAEFQRFEEDFKASLPKRHTAAGWIGFISWFVVFLYVVGYKGFIRREYF
jgi:hypothetical protein